MEGSKERVDGVNPPWRGEIQMGGFEIRSWVPREDARGRRCRCGCDGES